MPRLGELYERLVQPYAALLESDITGLLLVPTTDLWQIPFSALYDQERNQFLSSRFHLQMLPNFRMIENAQRSSFKMAPGLIVGVAGDETTEAYLPAVEQEVVEISRVLGDNAVTLKNQHGTVTQLLDTLAHNRPVGLFHVATHIEFDVFDPMRSGIRMADNELFAAADFYVRPGLMQGALVVLSGCGSGRVRPTGTELLGLNSAVLYAGARGIVASLWPISDEFTQRFMVQFYEALTAQTSINPAVALSTAMQAFQQDDQYGSPYYWAAFTYSGL